MCNRYRMTAGRRAIAERYGIEVEPEYENLPPPELFPKRPGWVVRQEAGLRRLEVMRWGIPLGGVPYTNVRNLGNGEWRRLLSAPSQRCLVPASDFCEWSGEKGSKQEHWFSLPASPIFSFAGVWRRDQEGDVFAFLTCGYLGNPANHPKACPIVLQVEDEQRWLDGDHADACELAVPFPSQLMAVG
jgi:putative SOS response-associated peptidase YedK